MGSENWKYRHNKSNLENSVAMPTADHWIFLLQWLQRTVFKQTSYFLIVFFVLFGSKLYSGLLSISFLFRMETKNLLILVRLWRTIFSMWTLGKMTKFLPKPNKLKFLVLSFTSCNIHANLNMLKCPNKKFKVYNTIQSDNFFFFHNELCHIIHYQWGER